MYARCHPSLRCATKHTKTERLLAAAMRVQQMRYTFWPQAAKTKDTSEELVVASSLSATHLGVWQTDGGKVKRRRSSQPVHLQNIFLNVGSQCSKAGSVTCIA